jgi:hypothetical protein
MKPSEMIIVMYAGVDGIPKAASQKNLSRVLKDTFDANADGVFAFNDYKR